SRRSSRDALRRQAKRRLARRWRGLQQEKNLSLGGAGDLIWIGGAPQIKAAIQAVDLAEALLYQVGRGALAGIAVVATDDQGRVEVGVGDEGMQRLIIQVQGLADVARGKTVRVTDVDHHRTLETQLLGLFGWDALEVGHGG